MENNKQEYKVVDELCCLVSTYDDLNEAREHALNIQGFILDENDNFIADYSW